MGGKQTFSASLDVGFWPIPDIRGVSASDQMQTLASVIAYKGVRSVQVA